MLFRMWRTRSRPSRGNSCLELFRFSPARTFECNIRPSEQEEDDAVAASANNDSQS